MSTTNDAWILLRDYRPNEMHIRGGVSHPHWPNGGRSIAVFKRARNGAGRGQKVTHGEYRKQDEDDARLAVAAVNAIQRLARQLDGDPLRLAESDVVVMLWHLYKEVSEGGSGALERLDINKALAACRQREDGK